RYSPHDNPAERIWGALKNYVANTAVSWPGRLRQIRSFFRARSLGQMLATAAPGPAPGCHRVTNRTFGMPLSVRLPHSAQHSPPVLVERSSILLKYAAARPSESYQLIWLSPNLAGASAWADEAVGQRTATSC